MDAEMVMPHVWKEKKRTRQTIAKAPELPSVKTHLRELPEEVLERKRCCEAVDRDRREDREDRSRPLRKKRRRQLSRLVCGQSQLRTMMPIPAAVMIWKPAHIPVEELYLKSVNSPKPISIRIQPT